MVKKYAEFILGHRWIIVILAVSWIMAMGAGAQHLTFTNDYRVFFGKDNPQLMAFENLQDTYAKNDNVMLVLVPADGEVFTRETALLDPGRVAQQLPAYLGDRRRFTGRGPGLRTAESDR
jgi:predicted RND superfamily exporter protein